MTKKPTGLAAFTKQGKQAQPDNNEAASSAPTADTTETKPRQRGKGDIVALTVRLSRDDWQRVHQLALSEGVSIQKLAVDGLSRLFEEKGLKGISP
ncbi:hypothetical protein [Thiothrix nivea]|uniref:Uncharacterized protein n=1 Tax=Thiothrix nivea (strain ATCC 35100 / DSM 5205 / JP2) TaxID=870187 RepID=A0A656HLC2_THINJ|nr:hypothetical protein [Thiothrix nivea]EIJ37042.1 hypothetical protein Thini_0027 [Thiothrix nivea DSM 5205]